MKNAANVPDLFSDLITDIKKDPIFDAISWRVYVALMRNNSVLIPDLSGETPGEIVYPEDKAVKARLSADAGDITRVVLQACTSGETQFIYCDKEMSQTVEMSASLLTAQDIGSKHLLPSEVGFCYFNGGVRTSENMVIYGLLWLPIYDSDTQEENIYVFGFNDSLTDPDGSYDSWVNTIKQRGFESVPEFRWVYRSMTQYPHNKPVTLDKNDLLIKAFSADTSKGTVIPINNASILHALSLMMKQDPDVITVERRPLINKGQIKRAKSRKLATTVTVVDIFHKYVSSYSAPTDSNREYSRRWLVTGHWRWQLCKNPETGEREKRRVWVHPYIKGPADKPFVATKRVHALLK